MKSIQISAIDVRLGEHRYRVEDLVNDIYRDKLDEGVREYFLESLGVETVYKSRKLPTDSNSESKSLGDIYLESAQKVLDVLGKRPEHVGQLITINDNSQRLDPAPTTEMVSRLKLRKDVLTQNFQGMACSAVTQSFRSALGNYVLPNSKGDTLVLVSSFYTDWFLPIFEKTEKVSMEDKDALNNFAYFLMFSDAVGSAYMSKPEKTDYDYSILVDLNMMSTRKDNTPHGWEKSIVRLSENLIPKMYVNSKLLRETSAKLSAENTSYLNNKFHLEYRSARVANLHTAGKKFMDEVAVACEIPKEKTKLSYDILRETGNTGAVSSLQLIKESAERKFLNNGDYGLMVDYGWEGADAFLYKMV